MCVHRGYKCTFTHVYRPVYIKMQTCTHPCIPHMCIQEHTPPCPLFCSGSASGPSWLQLLSGYSVFPDTQQCQAYIEPMEVSERSQRATGWTSRPFTRWKIKYCVGCHDSSLGLPGDPQRPDWARPPGHLSSRDYNAGFHEPQNDL